MDAQMAIINSLLVGQDIFQNIIMSKLGIPLANGVITFYESDMITLKPVYYQTGNGPYTYLTAPNPMVLSAAGTTVDVNGNDILLYFYPWISDSDGNNVPDPYFITVYDSLGTFQFSRSNFPFSSGAIPPEQTIATLENIVNNNRFWRNTGSTIANNAGTLPNIWANSQYNAGSTVYYKTLCPSQHDGFSMPDINYIKNINGSCTESISFNTFPGASTPILVGDIQPEYYIQHNCTADTSGATLKVYQFPLSLHLATLAGQPMTFTIQGKSTSGTAKIGVYLYQFCGTGVNSPIPILMGYVTFGSNWERTIISDWIFPGTQGVVIGSGGTGGSDDAYYLQLAMPTGATTSICNLSFCLPSVYLSNGDENVPTNCFNTYDQIDSIIAASRTGDIKTSLSTFYPFGWVPMSGGTIANAGTITAPTNNVGIAYQGLDAWALYNMLWNLFSSYNSGTTNLLAQMYSSAGSAVAYGTNSWSDWVALNQMALTNMMGQVLLGTVPVPAMPLLYSAAITGAQLSSGFTASGTALNPLLLTIGSTPQTFSFGEVVQVSNSGGGLPGGLAAVTNYYVVPISPTTFNLSTTLANAQAGLVILWTTNGTGTQTVVAQSLVLTAANTVNLYRGVPITFSNTGGALPTGLSAGVVYYAVPSSTTLFCVATTFANAMAGTYIAYAGAGTPTSTVMITVAGANTGEYGHTQLGNEVGPHNHLQGSLTFTGVNTASGSLTNVVIGGGGSPSGLTLPATSYTSLNTPARFPANVTQPGNFMNMYIKL